MEMTDGSCGVTCWGWLWRLRPRRLTVFCGRVAWSRRIRTRLRPGNAVERNGVRVQVALDEGKALALAQKAAKDFGVAADRTVSFDRATCEERRQEEGLMDAARAIRDCSIA